MRASKSWGFDPHSLEASVRAQDDFFAHVNARWIRTHPIPVNESRWGSFLELRYKTEKQIFAIVNRARKNMRAPQGSPEQMIRDLYASAADLRERGKRGVVPLAPFRARIARIRTHRDLVQCLGALERAGVAGVWDFSVDQDAKRSTHYAAYLEQSGLGLPDRDYYLKDDAESQRIRAAYREHMERIHRLAGFSRNEGKARSTRILSLETALARISMNKVDRRDPHKTYHKKTRRELARLAPEIDWDVYFKALGANPKAIIVSQPKFLSGAATMTARTPLETWKQYLEWQVLNGSAGLLSLPFIQESFRFYSQTLLGTKKMKPLWRRALGAVNGGLGELVGKLYVREHFPPEAKRRMLELVDDLFNAYAKRINALDWMSSATKRKALAKLRAMNVKIGYPSKWKSYVGLRIDPKDYFGNIGRIHAREHARECRRIGKRVERHEWFMTPQTVNAYFSPTMNEIVFPAAILQPPFFSMAADDAINYGATGWTIGHEITHGFDDSGSKFDKHGNIKTWWTPADRTRFEKRAAKIVRQYGAYEVLPGIRVNGKLTLGENIADLGGASIAYDAYQERLKKTGRKNIQGFTPEQRFFFGFAQGDREHARPEFMKTIVNVDPHSPSEFRINGVLTNLPEFYEAFGVRKGHKLYRKPNERAKIW